MRRFRSLVNTCMRSQRAYLLMRTFISFLMQDVSEHDTETVPIMEAIGVNRISTITAGGTTRSFSYAASGQVSQDVRDASHTYTFAANDNGRNASAALNGTTAGA